MLALSTKKNPNKKAKTRFRVRFLSRSIDLKFWILSHFIYRYSLNIVKLIHSFVEFYSISSVENLRLENDSRWRWQKWLKIYFLNLCTQHKTRYAQPKFYCLTHALNILSVLDLSLSLSLTLEKFVLRNYREDCMKLPRPHAFKFFWKSINPTPMRVCENEKFICAVVWVCNCNTALVQASLCAWKLLFTLD